MKFVALLSGGKDSCFNIMKCVQYGHELVCLANLCPPAEFQGEDMDSFMYQTVAHNCLGAFSECLEVPLVRQEIRGSAVSQHLNYAITDDDEVEDLYKLLSSVKEQFPEVNSVSCGAILSNYQRFRVENVCSRLGLVPLHFLWMRDRESLLAEMVDSGLYAVLVKVSGGGLDPVKHVGKDLYTLRPAFKRLQERFGLDICGEGGEYESLVLDCPLFKRRIELIDTKIEIDKDDPSVGYLVIKAFRTVPKETADVPVVALEAFSLRSPSLAYGSPVGDSEKHVQCCASPVLKLGLDGLGSTSLLLPTPAAAGEEQGDACQSQLRDLFRTLSGLLLGQGTEMCDVCYVHLYVSDMALFSHVNKEYMKWFGQNPPSRSCIAVPLPEGVYVALDALCLAGSHAPIGLGRSARREVLHVQSTSEWAPMSIGPYSQGTMLGKSLVFAAGQIGLLPGYMEMLKFPDGDIHPNALQDELRAIFIEHDYSESKRETPRFCLPDVKRNLRPASITGMSFKDLLDAVPIPLMCELTLCLRNAHEVLCSLNADLRSRSALCVVYVSSRSLTARLGAGTAEYAHCVRSLVRVAQILIRGGSEMLWLKLERRLRMESSSSESTGGFCNDVDGGACSDCEEDFDIDELEEVESPVLVVEVASLPRAATVEVEITALCEHFSKCNYRTGQGTRTWGTDSTDKLAVPGDANLQVEGEPCWPLFRSAQGSAVEARYDEWLLENSHNLSVPVSRSATGNMVRLIGPNDVRGASVLTAEDVIVWSCNEQYTVSPSSFCIGALSSPLGGKYGSVLDSVRAIFVSINKLMWESSLKFSTLQFVKLFIPNGAVGDAQKWLELMGEIDSLSEIFFGFKLAMVPISTTSIISDDGVSSVGATFAAIDLLQMKTEMWTRGD